MQIGRTNRGRIAATATLLLAGVLLAGCQAPSEKHSSVERIKSDPKERFTEADYGVKASPRVTDLKVVPKGGGRAQVGRPYKVSGKWYYPKEQPGHVKVGNASWYGSSFHGRLTANGEVYDMFGLSGAHPTFPLPSYAKVTNVETGANVMVRINDRGPYVADRMMDLSSKAAEMLGYKEGGLGRIKVEYVGKAPLDGDDTPMLMASYHPGNVAPSIGDGLASGVMLAMNETSSRALSAPRRAPPVDGLPGVRPAAAAPSVPAETSIDAIISGSIAAGTPAGAKIPLPRPRREVGSLVVASYALDDRPVRGGAAAAFGLLAETPAAAVRRIEIGLLDAEGLTAVRAIAGLHGRLVAEADGSSTTYALDLPAGEDADEVLRQLWRAGAADAFALRD